MSHTSQFSTRRFALALSASALCALTPMLEAQRPYPTPVPFLAVDWGTPVDTVLQQAQAAGWLFLTIDEDGDYAFRMTLDGDEALVFATFGDRGLTRLLVSVAPNADPEVAFKRLSDTLRTYFGPAELTSTDGDARPAPWMVAATAWQGVLMGLRRDRRILILFTCPWASPELPVRRPRPPIT